METNIEPLDLVKLKSSYGLLHEGDAGIVLSLGGTNFCLMQRRGFVTHKSTFWIPLNILTPVLRKINHGI